MSVLQDQCPKEDFRTIKGIISKEVDFDMVFASFEEEPIGVASIGQGKEELSLLKSLMNESVHCLKLGIL